jgi:YD repeat-containing protein
VASDGSIYISDLANGRGRIRRVGSDGIINTVAGLDLPSVAFNGDGIPAAQTQLLPRGLDIGPDGALYVAVGEQHRIRRIHSPMPGVSVSEIIIPSEDGQQLYWFDFQGRHLRTLNALTGASLYEFGYDGQGRLVTITDGDGNITRIERDSMGILRPLSLLPDSVRRLYWTPTAIWRASRIRLPKHGNSAVLMMAYSLALRIRA